MDAATEYVYLALNEKIAYILFYACIILYLLIELYCSYSVPGMSNPFTMKIRCWVLSASGDNSS